MVSSMWRSRDPVNKNTMRFKESCLYRCTLESSIQLLYYKHYQIRKIANMTAQEKNTEDKQTQDTKHYKSITVTNIMMPLEVNIGNCW